MDSTNEPTPGTPVSSPRALKVTFMYFVTVFAEFAFFDWQAGDALRVGVGGEEYGWRLLSPSSVLVAEGGGGWYFGPKSC